MMAEEAGKLPLRRLEPPIQKFIKVAIPTDLERLHQHQHNIEKFQRNGQWDKLHQEHINSSRTVQGREGEKKKAINSFRTQSLAQQEKIDSIEANVSIAAANVEEGTQSLGKAARSKLAVLPMAGAVVGGVLGGPLGLLAGFKVAGVAAAVGGGLLGFAGGNLIQRKKKERIDLQIQQIKSNNNSKNDTQ
ncbi:syntaxin-17-like [Sinocyclocheilus grahami]|uniref:syntaxin-17-like n=1 Tax=Sinocyclocheilus grahami TaxID=75366 RepID=UPI0007AD3198|nr:PREDICTED: syntaxin-17-like [Sinocyclocheilus grahami]